MIGKKRRARVQSDSEGPEHPGDCCEAAERAVSIAAHGTYASGAQHDGGVRTDYFLNRFANAWRASVGPLEDVSRSTTVRGANSSQDRKSVV